jgi:hypothetical protein
VGAGEGASASRSRGPRLPRPSWDLLRTICARRASCSRDFILQEEGGRGWAGPGRRRAGPGRRRAGLGGLTWPLSTAPASPPPGPGAPPGTGPARELAAQGSACEAAPDGAAQLWLSAPGRRLPRVAGTLGWTWGTRQGALWVWGTRWAGGIGALTLPPSPSSRPGASPGGLGLLLLFIRGFPVQDEPCFWPCVLSLLPQHLHPLLLQLSGCGVESRSGHARLFHPVPSHHPYPSPSSSCIFRRSSAPTRDTRLGWPSAWGSRTSSSKYFCRSRKDSCSGEAAGPGMEGWRKRGLRLGWCSPWGHPHWAPSPHSTQHTWAALSSGGCAVGTAAKAL